MTQTTRRQVSDRRDSLDASQGLPFHEILRETMVEQALAAEGVEYHDAIFTPLVTLCTFLSRVLDPDHSCHSAVARVIVWVAITGRKPCSEYTGAYCDARRRLPREVLIRLVRQTGRETEQRAGTGWLWKGRRVGLADGSTGGKLGVRENRAGSPWGSNPRNDPASRTPQECPPRTLPNAAFGRNSIGIPDSRFPIPEGEGFGNRESGIRNPQMRARRRDLTEDDSNILRFVAVLCACWRRIQGGPDKGIICPRYDPARAVSRHVSVRTRSRGG